MIPGRGKGNGNPLQCSYWRILWAEESGGLQSMGVAKSQTGLSNKHPYFTSADPHPGLLGRGGSYLLSSLHHIDFKCGQNPAKPKIQKQPPQTILTLVINVFMGKQSE